MAAYTLQSINPGTAFLADAISNGFLELEAIMNATIGDHVSGELNIPNIRSALYGRDFRPSSLTQVFRSNGISDETFLVLYKGSSAAMPYGAWSNLYDVAGSGLSFYLKENADVQISSRVDIMSSSEGHPWSLSTPATGVEVQLSAELILDGNTASPEAAVELRWDSTSASTRRGGQVVVNALHPNLGAGYHTLHLHLDFSGSTLTGTIAADNTTFVQLYGEGGSTTAIAYYR